MTTTPPPDPISDDDGKDPTDPRSEVASTRDERPSPPPPLAVTIVLLLVVVVVVVGSVPLLLLSAPFLLVGSVAQRVRVSRLRWHTPPSTLRIAVIGGGRTGLRCAARLRELGVGDVRGFEKKEKREEQRSDDDDAFRAAEVTGIEYVTRGSKREANLAVRDPRGAVGGRGDGETRTEGPFDLVIYAASSSRGSEPRFPDLLPGREEFRGEIRRGVDFTTDRFEDIVERGNKKVVVVGGSEAGCDLALRFRRRGYADFRWVYRKPRLFRKEFRRGDDDDDGFLVGLLRGLATLVGMLLMIAVPRFGCRILSASGLVCTRDDDDDDERPEERRDLAAIPPEVRVRGDPKAFTATGIVLEDGTTVEADVVLLATGRESGIGEILLKGNHRRKGAYTLDPDTDDDDDLLLLDHFLVPDFPVLANSAALRWTAVNPADMAVYHLCVRPKQRDREMIAEASRQRRRRWRRRCGDRTSSDSNESNDAVEAFLRVHLDLIREGIVNVADFAAHIVSGSFRRSRERRPPRALEIRLPPMTGKIHDD